jgi:predicted transcriptional regulator
MPKKIEVTDDTNQTIRELKRLWLEQTGTYLNDDEAIALGVGLFLKVSIAPKDKAFFMFKAQIAEHRLKKMDFDS